MIYTKEQFDKDVKNIKKFKLGALIFFILAMVCMGVSVAFAVVAAIIGSKGGTWYVFGYIAGLLMSVGFALLIIRSVFFTGRLRLIAAMQAQIQARESDLNQQMSQQNVSSFQQEASRENKLYQQYENLYKQGLITQEDLEKKRKELLGE